MQAELFRDKRDAGSYRVEAINNEGEGGCEVAAFSGPDALRRALAFARLYYPGHLDRTQVG